MSHLYFNEESDYSEENSCENEVFCLAATGVLSKKVLIKLMQNSQETLVPEKRPMNFGKFLRITFLQNNSG